MGVAFGCALKGAAFQIGAEGPLKRRGWAMGDGRAAGRQWGAPVRQLLSAVRSSFCVFHFAFFILRFALL
jgi:hypothetical protein